MAELLTPVQLGPKQIDQAFPIVQSVVPRLNVEDWRVFANKVREAPEGHAGIMTVQYQGYIHGLFSYRVEPHLVYSRVLVVDNFIVLDLFHPGAVAEALLRAMDSLARQLGCRATHTLLPSGPEAGPHHRHWLLGRFNGLGHHVECLTLCKRLYDGPAPRAKGNGSAAVGYAGGDQDGWMDGPG